MGLDAVEMVIKERNLGVWVNRTIKLLNQCAEAAKRKNLILKMIKGTHTYMSRPHLNNIDDQTTKMEFDMGRLI